ncbi:SPT20 family protein [Nakaseomyces bracarensis]|uniref:SPT20 family protein n=1 Tax=Nakaseomyces bracarensis TaxID=273131 RepID=UPI0038716285
MSGSPGNGYDSHGMGIPVNGVTSPGSPVNIGSPMNYGASPGAGLQRAHMSGSISSPDAMNGRMGQSPGGNVSIHGHNGIPAPPHQRSTNIGNGSNVPGMTQTGQPLSQRQMLQQRMLLRQQQAQQAQHQRQIALQNYETQFNQLLMTQNTKPRRIYNFVEDPQGLLRKYEQYRPSFEFHIYENNYKICAPANTRLQQQQKNPELTSDGLILNKNNETLKEFLEHVARGRIPYAIMEVLRDCNIQFYEGNLILQVYDHTNTVDVFVKDTKNQSQNVKSPNKGQEHIGPRGSSHDESEKPVDNSIKKESTFDVKATHNEQNRTVNSQNMENTNALGSPGPAAGSQQTEQKGEKATEPANKSSGSGTSDKKEKPMTYKRPRVYRTLLRPNDLSQYYDMMSYADHSRFSDSIYQQFESEILTITKRNLSLEVPLNPYEHRDKLESELFLEPLWDDEKQKWIHHHRSESSRKGTRGTVAHIPEHVDNEQKTSEYEQLMLIMNERTTTSTSATFAAILTKNALDKAKAASNGSGDEEDQDGVGSTGGRDKDRFTTGNKVALAAATAAASLGGANNDTNQFRRLKFIEQWKINKEKRKQQTLANNMLPTTYNTRISMTTQGGEGNTRGAGSTGGTNTGDSAKAGSKNAKAGNKRAAANTSDKPSKVKKPRKTKAKAADGESAPKKKKAPAKKKQQSQHSDTAGSPNNTGTPAAS